MIKFEKILAVMADDGDAYAASKVHSLISILALHLAARMWAKYIVTPTDWRMLLALGLALAFVLSFSSRMRHVSIFLTFTLVATRLAGSFPNIANHSYLEFVCVSLICFADRSSTAGQRVLMQSMKWLPAILFFYAGLQKILYGTYLHGTYLAFLVATNSANTVSFFQWIIPPDELTRLLQTEFPGPYLFSSWPPVVLSNAVYVSEMLIALTLIPQRCRRIGAIGAFLLLIGIQVFAREMMFGMLCCNLLLVYAPTDWNKKLLPLSAIAYAGLLVWQAQLV